MLEVEYRARAALDIESIVIYIGEVLDSPQTARETYENLMASIDLLREVPTLGKRIIDDRFEQNGYRVYLSGQYRIAYRYGTDKLTIWRVVHTLQDIDDYALIEF